MIYNKLSGKIPKRIFMNKLYLNESIFEFFFANNLLRFVCVIVVSSQLSSAIFLLYHGKNKLIVNEMTMSPLCSRPKRFVGFL